MSALYDAEKFCEKNETESKKIISNEINVTIPYLDSVWEKQNLKLSLEQSLYIVLENEAKWIISENFSTATPIPNYQRFIYEDALKTVNPEAVTIVR